MRWTTTRLLLIGLAACGTPTDPAREADTGFATDFEVCVEVRETASFRPVTLLLSVDKSGSLDDGNPRKWDAVSSAMTTFINDERASELDVALRLWPQDDCDVDECDAQACSDPTIDPAPLADESHRDALVDALRRVEPEGDTPTSAALEGAGQWALERRDDRPGEVTAIVLVTDGIPRGCDENIGNIAAIGSEIADNGVSTFVVGIQGSREAQLDRIANASGTDQAYFAGEADAEANLVEALRDIQGRALSCELELPNGEVLLDPDLVRVEVTEEGKTSLLRRRRDIDACDPEGWYLDEDARVVLCPESCERLQTVSEVSVDVAAGCACETDEDCPSDEVCIDGSCVDCTTAGTCESGDTGDGGDGGGIDGPNVQGGAWNCAAGPTGGSLLSLLALLAVARRRVTA